MSRSSSRNWLSIGLVVGGFVLVFALLGAIIHWTSTPYGRAFATGFASSLVGGTGPGAKAVRKAGRCQTASVLSSESVRADDAGDLDMDFVICVLPIASGSVPTCDDLAQTYVDAVKPSRKFMVEVKRIGGADLLCQSGYSADGTLTKRFRPGK